MFDEDYVPLNHGSFGAFPRVVQEKFFELSTQNEAKPDTYIRYEYPALLEESRSIMAEMLNVEPSTVVFQQNATTALNVILRSLAWAEGDVILTCSLSMNS